MGVGPVGGPQGGGKLPELEKSQQKAQQKALQFIDDYMTGGISGLTPKASTKAMKTAIDVLRQGQMNTGGPTPYSGDPKMVSHQMKNNPLAQ